jgi:folate-dependent tRNA-U54 methylase TrmFO/GidA
MHDSFFILNKKKHYISSLRFSSLDDTQSVEVSFIKEANIMYTFSAKKLTIKVVTQTDINKDVVIFQANGKTIQKIYSNCVEDKEIYSKYITTLIN